jgi:hypothetical protein
VPRALVAALLLAVAVAGCDLSDDDTRPPQLGARANDEQAAAKLGFPATATRNTIRVGGGDATSDAAGVANALYPAASAETRPPAVALVDKDAWQAAIAAAVLASPPLGIPTLLTDGDDLPAVTGDTLDRLDPRGSDLSQDAQIVRVGDEPPSPSGMKVAKIAGKDPYRLAAAIDRYAAVARGAPSNDVVVTTGEDPAYAMPAAAWAGRSGDAVLFVSRASIPPATRRALRRHDRPDIFLLGPKRAISARVERGLRRLGRVTRIAGASPVSNSIAFARFRRRGFGWGVTVPGFNFTIANASRPGDAAAAGALGSNGVFAPLLVTDRADPLPPALEGYFLDVQPGFTGGDPSNAVYNRVWILGDESALSIKAQARVDEITELVPVREQSP